MSRLQKETFKGDVSLVSITFRFRNGCVKTQKLDNIQKLYDFNVCVVIAANG